MITATSKFLYIVYHMDNEMTRKNKHMFPYYPICRMPSLESSDTK